MTITVENARTLKRADQLAVGDRRDGTSKYDKDKPVVWTVRDVQTKLDPFLGIVIQVNASIHTVIDGEGNYLLENHEFFLRPSERVWVF